jgi:(p)ppGpp synthase/HD superfamily hydrolase
VDVSWVADKGITYPAKIYVETVDRPGILASLSSMISSMDVNISHFEGTSTRDSRARFTFLVAVNDRSQVVKLIQKIASIEGVIRVRR